MLEKLLTDHERERREQLMIERQLQEKLENTSGALPQKDSKKKEKPVSKCNPKPEPKKSFMRSSKRKTDVQEREFAEELIRPCLCDSTWHRSCIRELVVKLELTACPKCRFEYSVGYTDC